MGSSGRIFLALRSAFIALPEADAGVCNARLFQKRQASLRERDFSSTHCLFGTITRP